MEAEQHSWSEADSQEFLRSGGMFVPLRELQARILVDLIPASEEPFGVVDLGCGEGLTSFAVLRRYPTARVTALDGSAAMVAAANDAGAVFGDRFSAIEGQIEAFPAGVEGPIRAVVSSLALHHLRHADKARVFESVAARLDSGGLFAFADVILPAHPDTHRLAARLWDESVEAVAVDIDDPAALQRFRNDGWNMYALAQIDPEDRPATLLQLLEWLGAAGFTSIDVAWLHAGHAIIAGWIPQPRV